MAKDEKLWKNSLNRVAVKRLAGAIHCAWSPFDHAGFVKTATKGLFALELKARVHHVISALRLHLPEDTKQCLSILVEAGRHFKGKPDGDALGGFAAWPLVDFVGVYGLSEFDASMKALHALTPLFSAEFAIRPFIAKHPQKALVYFRRWTKDPNEHVRRLVSEGTRPRLPWGSRLPVFDDNPSPILALLNTLKDDPSAYVRRSVANHLNDISKDQPDVIVDLCERWIRGAQEHRLRLIRHASRTLIKAGHPRALATLGFDPKARVRVTELKLSKKRVRLGSDLEIGFCLQSTSSKMQPLIVDYTVHHVKKNGTRSPKVFKLRTLELAPKERLLLTKVHQIRKITTRTYHSGRHTIEIMVNGRPKGHVDFELRAG